MAHRESLAKASAAAIMQQQQRGHYADDDGVVLAMEKAKIPARAFRRDLIARPKHHSLIRSFSLKHPTYGPACRIAKRWMEAAAAAPEDEIGSQLGPKTIGPRASLQPLQRFPDEAIELIVAAESFDIFIMLDPVSLGPIASLTSITKMMGRKKKKNNNNNSKKTKREGGGGGGHDDGVEENKCLERALPGFDPVDFFVKDLQISVGKYLEIGYDIYGAYGGIVVAKWKNDSKTPRKFSVATAAHLCPVLRNDTPTTSGRKKRKRAADSAVVVTGKSKIVTSSDFVVPDVEGIIQTIKRIGIVQEVFIGYAAYLKATKSGKNKK
eukprot:jgi/Bigna1/140563/aug1.57_g15271